MKCPLYKFIGAVEMVVATGDVMTGNLDATLNRINCKARALIRDAGYELPKPSETLKVVKRLV
jgi:ACT domain-containing protein